MDLASGLIASNEPMSRSNPMGAFVQGARARPEVESARTKAEQERYQLDLQYKLQDAINRSIDDKGDIDYNALARHGAALGIAAPALDYAIKTLPEQWDAVRKAAQAKNTTQAIVSPESAEAINQAAKPSWRTQPAKPRSSLSPAAPPEKAPEAAPVAPTTQPITDATVGTRAPQQALLPPPEGDRPDTGEGGVVRVTAAPPAAPIESVPEAPPTLLGAAQVATVGEADSSGDYESTAPINAPIVFSALAPATKQKMAAALVQAGQVGAQPTDEDVQNFLESQWRSYKSSVPVPDKNMAVDPVKGFDPSAWAKIKADYKAKLAEKELSFYQDFGKKYGEQLAQKLQLESNERAAQANAREQTNFGQVQDEVQTARSQGFRNVNASNVGDFRTVKSEYDALQNARGQIQGLREGVKAGKYNSELGKDTFNSEINAITTRLKVAENINSLAADENFESSMRKTKSLGQVISESGGFKDFLLQNAKNGFAGLPAEQRLDIVEKMYEHAMAAGNVKSKLDNFRGTASAKEERAKPAKAPKASTSSTSPERLPGESFADFLRRTRK
jgi:hypothetical protein